MAPPGGAMVPTSASSRTTQGPDSNKKRSFSAYCKDTRLVRFRLNADTGQHCLHEDVLKLHASEFHEAIGHKLGPLGGIKLEEEPRPCASCPHRLHFEVPVFQSFTQWLLSQQLPDDPSTVIQIAMLGKQLRVHKLEDDAMTFLFVYYKARQSVPRADVLRWIFPGPRDACTQRFRQFCIDIYYASAKPADLDVLDRTSPRAADSIFRGMCFLKAHDNEDLRKQGHVNALVMRLCDYHHKDLDHHKLCQAKATDNAEDFTIRPGG